ncbi:MAG: ribonuclease III [Deltaproteobacteria bacterium]|nr:ribonuclease III [Deltaproteobacteria bacterium]
MELPDGAAALASLTHSSYVNEHPGEGRIDNERLEFLGDAVIDLAVSERLVARFPEDPEGVLTRMRAALVDEEGLSTVARTMQLGELLLLGRGEEQTGGRDKPSVLADALEAVICVVFQAAGLPGVHALVDRFFGPALDRVQEGLLRDAKTLVQEAVQSRFRSPPRYRVVSEQGPDHLKVFTVEVLAGGETLGRGEGHSKKEAEQAAAREALRRLTPGTA